MRRPRGFSLLEMMVALAISAVVVAVGTQVIAAMLKTTKKMAANAQLDSQAQLITEALAAEAQGVGGGALRPAGAVMVNNKRAGDPPPVTDELTLLIVDDTKNPCGISGFHSNKPKFIQAGTCCANTEFAANNLVALVSPDGDKTGVKLFSPLGGGCKMNVSASDFPTAPTLAVMETQFTGGSALVVRQRKYFLDDTTHQLQVLDTDLSGNSRTRIVAENVYDFQVALGYDVPNPARDGVSTDTGGTDDEWLFNAVGDSFALPPLNQGTNADLQRLAIGITVGVKQTDGGGNTIKLLDGSNLSIPGVYLRSSISRITFRNLFLFQ